MLKLKFLDTHVSHFHDYHDKNNCQLVCCKGYDREQTMTIGNTKVPMLKSPYNPFKKELREKFINARKKKTTERKLCMTNLQVN
jgi:hypothetical protein